MKKMKRIFATLCVMVLLVTSIPVYAEQTASSSIIYTVEDSYYIYIPETIIVGEDINITAQEVNITDGKSIYVKLDGYADHVDVTNIIGDTIPIHFTNSDGEVLQNDFYSYLAKFESGETNVTKTFYANPGDTTSALAGEYTGIVYFIIECY